MPGIDHPYGKRGKINDYTYWFHGSGCSLEKDISLWKFKQFVITHPQYKNEDQTDKHLEKELYKLIEKKVLSWVIDGGVVWEVYKFNS